MSAPKNYRIRSSKTGRFMTKEQSEQEHPDTWELEEVKETENDTKTRIRTMIAEKKVQLLQFKDASKHNAEDEWLFAMLDLSVKRDIRMLNSLLPEEERIELD